jgi:polysaccharide pyruvyl transferase WcaK-like protein
MKIAHIAKHSHNIGEGALVDGLRSTLSASSKVPIQFVDYDRKLFQSIAGAEFTENSVGLKLDKNFFKKLNLSSDGLIIGGGGIIQSGRYENFGGLCVAGDLGDFNQLDIPVFLYAIGDNRLKSEYQFDYVEDFKSLVSKISSSGGLCSVRNDGTFERLSDLIDNNIMDSIEIVPDPGLFVARSDISHPLVKKGKVNIAIQLAGDRLKERLHNNNSKIQENGFLKSIAESIYRLSKKYDLNIIVCPHIATDFFITAKFLDICSGYKIGNSSMTREIMHVNHCTKGYEAASEYFSVYDQCDLVFGMRGHSAICSVGLGTPFIGLNSHEKLGGFLDGMGLGDFSLDIVSESFGDKLNILSEMLLQDSSSWSDVRNKSVHREIEILNRFNDKILATLT